SSPSSMRSPRSRGTTPTAGRRGPRDASALAGCGTGSANSRRRKRTSTRPWASASNWRPTSPTPPDSARSWPLAQTPGAIWSREWRAEEAASDAAVAIYEQLAAISPHRPEFREELAESHNNRGNLLSVTGRFKEAEADYDAALGIQKQLAADFPNQSDLHNDL